jgi:hypothetical protein
MAEKGAERVIERAAASDADACSPLARERTQTKRGRRRRKSARRDRRFHHLPPQSTAPIGPSRTTALYSLANQALMWLVIGATWAALAARQRVLKMHGVPSEHKVAL